MFSKQVAKKKPEVIDDVLNEEEGETGEVVDFPDRRPVPKEVMVLAGSMFPDRMGRQPHDVSFSFDGYTLTCKPDAYPPIDAIKGYEITIERDGQVFFTFYHKIFKY